MGKHRIKIRIPGENEFIEEFRGPSVESAKDRARVLYPDAAKISWVGGGASPSTLKKQSNDTYTPPRAAGGMDQPHEPASSNNTQFEAPDIDGAGALLWFVIKWWVIYCVVVGFAPVVAGVCTGKVANKATRGKGLKVRIAATALAGLSALAGTDALQKEYQPELHQDRIEFIQNITGMNK